MQDTPNLALPLIAAAQAEKHVTHNEALLAIDALLHCAVLDKDLAGPPAAPAAGARYIVAAGATGAWSGRSATVAAWEEGAGWRYHAPAPGFLAFVADESQLYLFDGAAWVPIGSVLAAIQNLGRLGIGTTADSANPFSAKLNTALWTAKTVSEGGDGDLRYTLNKESAADVLSLLFQTGFSGRLEIGLVGSDDLSVKVSQDGTNWRQALTVDAASGSLDFLSNEGSVASAATCNIGDVPNRRVVVTGASTITSFGGAANRERHLRFAGALTLTHHATTLVLPGGANIATAAGDTAFATSDGAGNWRVRAYQKASGLPLATAGLAPTTIRERLAANRTYWVRPDGSDTHTGLANTAGGAFLTKQKAYDTVANTLDLAEFTVTIQVGDGAYPGSLVVSQGWVGGGAVVVQGNVASPASCVVSAALAFQVTAPLPGTLTLKGFKTTSNGNYHIQHGGVGTVNFGNWDFAGTGSPAQITARRVGAQLVCTAPYTISSGANLHIEAIRHAGVLLNNQTITLAGNPAWTTAFASILRLANLEANGTTFSGPATGPRYVVDDRSLISTNGGGATFLPGSMAGTLTVTNSYV